MAKSTHPLLLRLAPWLLPVGTVIVWQLASSVGWLSTRVLPSPEGVLKAFWTLSASGELWQHLAISSWRALVGFAIGGSIGLILGLISGLSRWAPCSLSISTPGTGSAILTVGWLRWRAAMAYPASPCSVT